MFLTFWQSKAVCFIWITLVKKKCPSKNFYDNSRFVILRQEIIGTV